MKFYKELANYTPKGNTVITIGVFDGVHRGHLYLLHHLKEEAKRLKASPLVITFSTHPKATLKPDSTIRLITSLEDRISLLRLAGIDNVAVLTFDEALSKLKSEDFIDGLIHTLNMKGMVVGPNFALGYKREGDSKKLQEIGTTKEFEVYFTNPLVNLKEMISSSAIRESINKGDVEHAETMLGRLFSMSGLVIAGDGRGRKLGFPTANLKTDDRMTIPKDGIYATLAYVDGARYYSATSIGVNPTFGNNSRTVETYLMKFDGNLYGKQIKLEFTKRIRDQQSFDSANTLRIQMEKDVQNTAEILNSKFETGIG